MASSIMSQLKGCRRLALGSAELLFLRLFCLAGPRPKRSTADKTRPAKRNIWFGHGLAAYTLWDQLDRSMTYRNVWKTIQKLLKMGLIEEIKEKHRYRNAIKYKATTLGLFQHILNDPPSELTSEFKFYKDSAIFKTILYRYFEPETIDKFSEYYCDNYLKGYVRRCCQLILESIERRRLRLQKKGLTSDSAASPPLHQSFPDGIIEEELKKLMVTIVTSSNIVIDDPDTPDMKTIFPIETLKHDKKFMKVFQELKKDFDSGYQKFL